MQLSVGSIKGSLFSFTFHPEESKLTPNFAVQNHIGPITALQIDKWGCVATGGEDESVKVYDTIKGKETGSVFVGKGRVTSVENTRQFVLAASEDGHVSIIGKKDLHTYHRLKVIALIIFGYLDFLGSNRIYIYFFNILLKLYKK